jgi:hypothetical protein
VRIAGLLVALGLLSGCASPPSQLDRAQWLEMTSLKVNVPPEKAIEAAAEVLRLADPKDTTFSHQPDGFTAVRHSATFAIVAVVSEFFHWTVTATPDGGGTTLRASLSRSNQSAGAAPIGPGVVAPMGFGSGPGVAVNEPKLYALFWSRVESLLGHGPWTTCEAYGASVWGTTANALCGMGREDLRP